MKLAALASPTVLTVALATLNAAPSLIGAWRDAPFERWIWPFFLLWLLPCIAAQGRAGQEAQKPPTHGLLPPAATYRHG